MESVHAIKQRFGIIGDDPKLNRSIEKAIQVANLGFNPMNNGESVIINVPPLTEERRKELAKQAKNEAEESKIGVRNDRKNANQEIKKLEELLKDPLADFN